MIIKILSDFHLRVQNNIIVIKYSQRLYDVKSQVQLYKAALKINWKLCVDIMYSVFRDMKYQSGRHGVSVTGPLVVSDN